MNRRIIATRFSVRIPRRASRELPPRIEQATIDRALCSYFDAALVGHSPAMIRSVAVVAGACEQQVQCAMLHVQKARGVSRADLLTVLNGDERENHFATFPARHRGHGASCNSRRD